MANEQTTEENPNVNVVLYVGGNAEGEYLPPEEMLDRQMLVELLKNSREMAYTVRSVAATIGELQNNKMFTTMAKMFGG